MVLGSGIVISKDMQKSTGNSVMGKALSYETYSKTLFKNAVTYSMNFYMFCLLYVIQFSRPYHNLGSLNCLFLCGAFFSTDFCSKTFSHNAYPAYMQCLMVMSSTILELWYSSLDSLFFEKSIPQCLHPYRGLMFSLVLFFRRYLVNFRLTFVAPKFSIHKLLLVLLMSDIFKLLNLLIVFWDVVALSDQSSTCCRLILYFVLLS